jgi:hypothetical protein
MNCCDEYGQCNQGRDCPIRMERTLQEPSLFWDVMEGLVTLCAIVGVIAAGCFAFGYYWYGR